MNAGWKPRTMQLGDVWVNYDAFEPYNQILASKNRNLTING